MNKDDSVLDLFIQGRESFSAKPYLDGGGVPTIAFGSTEYEDGTRVKLTDSPVTRQRGLELFHHTLEKYKKCVLASVKVPMEQREFNAMVSLCYNIGVGAFAKSTLVKLMNQNAPRVQVGDQFLRWNKDNGRVVAGLTNRRVLERNLFLGV
jgi:lysozyme